MKRRTQFVDKAYYYEHMSKYKADIYLNRELILLGEMGITVYTNSFI